MKYLHKFTVNIKKEVEKTEVKNENGQEITVKSKVKEQVPHIFLLKRPARGELDSLRLFTGGQIKRAIDNGLMTKSVLVNKHVDGAGALLSQETAKRIIDLGEKIERHRNEILSSGSPKDEEGEKAQSDSLLKLLDAQKELQIIEASNQAIFSNTAEAYAQERANMWLILNQSYLEINGKAEPYFKGKNFEEKENYQFDLEEKEDELFFAASSNLALYWSFYSLGQAVTPEDFALIEKKLNGEEEPSVEAEKALEPEKVNVE